MLSGVEHGAQLNGLPGSVFQDCAATYQGRSLEDCVHTGERTRRRDRRSRFRMAEQSFKKARAAGVPIIFGSGATSASVPHGKQGNQFAYYVKWGMTPAQALQMPFLTTATMLNYNWVDKIGSVEKGKFADLVAGAGNPLTDVTEMERVRFVMKGGMVVRNDLGARPAK